MLTKRLQANHLLDDKLGKSSILTNGTKAEKLKLLEGGADARALKILNSRKIRISTHSKILHYATQLFSENGAFTKVL